MSAKIVPLSDEVKQSIRSGVAITAVPQCVEELVLNSVDAGCSCVAVRVDLTSWRIQVVDNGFGLTSKDLGKVGERQVHLVLLYTI